MTRVRAAGVSVELGGTPILDGCDLAVDKGEILGLVGPNGSGKSTLLRAVYRALRPAAGAVSLDETDVWHLSAKASAQRTAVVAQERSAEFDFSVAEIVMMGRGPHKGLLDRDGPEDHAIVAESLDRVGAAGLAGRVFATLSGGEKQRVLVARALAQRSQLLVLDEPTNHLDVRAQLELLELVTDLGLTTVAAMHDLNLAVVYCHRLAVISGGRIIATGPPTDVLTPELVEAVFGVAAHLDHHPATGRLQLHLAPLTQRSASV
jgi:iron complex transport system ATP-binding protein